MVSLENISIPLQRGSSSAMRVMGSECTPTRKHTSCLHPHSRAGSMYVHEHVCARL